MSRARDILLLVLLGLLAYLPGIASLPVIDRDEARYAQSVVQMVETGDYVDIRFQDEPRYKKPIGAYWVQAAAIHLTGQADNVRAGERPIWAQRLPSVAGALLAVLFTYLAGVALLGRRAAVIGAALLAVSVSLVFEAHQAKTDALLAGASAAVLYGLAARKVWAVWLGIAAGVLIKGPVIVAVAGLAVGTLALVDRLRLPPRVGEVPRRGDGGDWRSQSSVTARHKDENTPASGGRPLRPSATSPASGGGRWMWLLRPLPILVALAIVLPWFVAIGIKSEGAFFAEALGRDFGAKLGSAQETHGGPPGYYLLTTLVMFWPGVIALPLAGVWAWRERRVAEVALLLAWLVPMWVVLEFVPTKLPHYTLPLYPALALLCGGAVVAGSRTNVVGRVIYLLIGLALATVAAVRVSGLSFGFEGAIGLLAIKEVWIVALTLSVLVLGAALFARRRVGYAIVPAIVVLGYSFAFALPRDELWLGHDVGQVVGADATVYSPDFREPSLVYYAGTDTKLNWNEAPTPGDVILIEQHLFSDLPSCSEPMLTVGRNAFNYAKGSWSRYQNLFTTDACDAAELETWRAREVARRSGNSERDRP